MSQERSTSPLCCTEQDEEGRSRAADSSEDQREPAGAAGMWRGADGTAICIIICLVKLRTKVGVQSSRRPVHP